MSESLDPTLSETWHRAPRVGWRDHLAGALIALSYIVLLMSTANDIALSRDESFYVHAANTYGTWIELYVENREAALEPASIQAHWGYNAEHPPLMKTMFALSNLAHRKYDLFSSPSLAYRFPAIVMAGLLLWLVLIWGSRAYGRPVGVFGAVALAVIPRVFYHSHLLCFDIPVVFMLTLVAYCYWRSLTQPGWALLTGIAYGLALATKHNAWILPGVLLIHFGFVVLRERAHRRDGGPPRLSMTPYWLFAMLLLGPPIFIYTWPMLWRDTWPEVWHQFQWYASFHLNHEHYTYEYLGKSYFEPPFPIAAPFVQTWLSVPLSILLLAFVGIASRFRTLVPPGLDRWVRTGPHPDRRSTDVLLIGLLLAPMVAIALPSSPIFGGTKHWMPAYPSLVLFAGIGLYRVGHTLRDVFERRLGRFRLSTELSGVLALLLSGILAAAPAVADTVHNHPHGLSHWGYTAGGTPGAADLGMNRQFWGFTHGPLARWFREEMPDGGSVWICDATAGAWQQWQDDGHIPSSIRPAYSITAADYAIIHHEAHFEEVEFQIWTAYGTVTPATVLTLDGVPLVTVYKNPRR